jgi:putative membrane protein
VTAIVFGSDRGWDDHGWGAPWFGLALLVLLVIVGGIAFYRRSVPPPSDAGAESNAEQVLALRFARGEIDEDEYDARLATLRGSRPGGLTG